MLSSLPPLPPFPPLPRLLRNPAFWYVAVLAAMWPVLRLLPPERVLALREWASTNLDNLHPWPSGHPVESLAVSAFVPQSTVWVWPFFALSVFAVVSALGARRAVASLALAHVTATALTEALVWWRIEHGSLPATEAHVLDTGPSYVVVAALTVAVARARPVWSRAVWLLMLAVAAPDLLSGLGDGEVSAVGHVLAFAAGLAIAAAHRLGPSRTAVRIRDSKSVDRSAYSTPNK
ncbi:rhomboid-like protein [Kitasatospora sp. NPDC093806]|uniref:rhomboid-like protein n=1 Tax=Kitasatospora sp. NPDC093806 TaxID=3155075 RepID=UPI003431BA3C